MEQTKAAKKEQKLKSKGLMQKTVQTRLGPVTSIVKDPNYKKPNKSSGAASKVSGVSRSKGMY